MNKYLLTNLKPTPWKNNQGTTYQLDIFPPESSIVENNFDFRISFAEIHGANQFSKFENYERILTVIFGDGIKFNNEFLYRNQIFNFSGNDLIESDIINNQSAIDLGVIYNKNKIDVIMFSIEGNKIFTTNSTLTYFISLNSKTLEEIHIIKIERINEMIILNDKFDYMVIEINIK